MTSNPYKQKNERGRCTCSECGRTFGGIEGFDTHRINMSGKPGFDPEYDWRCANEGEMQSRGLHLSPKGWWIREAPSAPRPSPGPVVSER